MMPPVEEWGTQAFVTPDIYRTRCGNYVRVYSGADGNTIQSSDQLPHTINAGEFWEYDLVTQPISITSISHLPILVVSYAYSQNVNNDPGNADPYMAIVPPIEQWQTSAIFRLPTNKHANGDFTHFAAFVGIADSLLKITINGKTLAAFGATTPAKYPFSTIGTVTIQLPRDEKTFVVKSAVPFALSLHGNTAVDDYAYPGALGIARLGTLDSTPPTQTGVRASCFASTGTLKDTGGIATIALITDSVDLRWSKPSKNVTLTLTPYIPGDPFVNFVLNVIDSTQSGYAAVYAVDRSGNASLFEYNFAQTNTTISVTDSTIKLLTQFGQDSCFTTGIRNRASATTQVDASYMKIQPAGGPFRIQSSGGSSLLLPGDSLKPKICFSVSDTGTYADTLVILFECGLKRIALSARSVTGLISSTNASFGNVMVGDTACKTIQVKNIGAGILRLLAFDLQGHKELSLDTATHFPITLQPDSSISINLCWHPTASGFLNTTFRFTSANAKYDTLKANECFVSGSAQKSSVAILENSFERPIQIDQLTPNPSNGWITVEFRLMHPESSVHVEIINEAGAIAKSYLTPIVGRSHSVRSLFDLSTLPTGSYLLRLSSGDEEDVRKFVIQR